MVVLSISTSHLHPCVLCVVLARAEISPDRISTIERSRPIFFY